MLDPIALGHLRSVSELRTYLALADEVWQAFLQVVGDPGDDFRPLAALPRLVVVEAVSKWIGSFSGPSCPSGTDVAIC